MKGSGKTFGASEMIRGKVKFYDATRGFGFVCRDDGGPDIFVHASAMRRSGVADLAAGDAIEFLAEQDPRGRLFATNLRVLTSRVGGE